MNKGERTRSCGVASFFLNYGNMTDIEEIVRDFTEADYQETLELLLDYSESLPEVPKRLLECRDRDLQRVYECETPVFIWVEVQNGVVSIFADVPEESPTVRGLVSILVTAFNGTSPNEIEAAPHDLLTRLGLAQKLGIRRVRGLSAVYSRIKSEVRQQSAVS